MLTGKLKCCLRSLNADKSWLVGHGFVSRFGMILASKINDIRNFQNMDRIHINRLEVEQLGIDNVVGWYMDELNVDRSLISGEIKYPVFQSSCCNKRTVLTNHSIGSDGEVNASILCYVESITCSVFLIIGQRNI